MFQYAKRNVNYVRRLTSKRQVFESLVEFWSDHFNINDTSSKGGGLLNAYGLDWEISVIRGNAFMPFDQMLRAVVYHPAMILWLDGELSRKSDPNENFARELLELYTVTPAGGYTQSDIEQAAMLFSGLRGPVQGQPLLERATMPSMYRVNDQTFIDTRQQRYGTFRVMDWTSSASRPEEVVAAIDSLVTYLAGHPSTARSISTKLAQRFVADQPGTGIVDALSSQFLRSGGDPRQVLRTLVVHSDFASSVGRKTKRPAEDLLSLTRALKMKPETSRFGLLGRAGNLAAVNWGFDQLLSRLGHQHSRWPLPDGYPDTEEYWNDAASHVARWYAHSILLGSSVVSTGGMTKPNWSELLPTNTPLGLAELVDAVSTRLFQDALSTQSRQVVIDIAARARSVITASNRDSTCDLIAFLCVSLPEWVQR